LGYLLNDCFYFSWAHFSALSPTGTYVHANVLLR